MNQSQFDTTDSRPTDSPADRQSYWPVDPRMKGRLMETLHFCIAFFRQHGLRYYACGGTMLGAVRHGGLIPWDDDIDLYMPRPDYDRLLGMTRELAGTGYELIAPELDSTYYCPWAKVMDSRSTLWEYSYYRCTLGVYVDIFPLDAYQGSPRELLAIQKRYFACFNRFLVSLKRYSWADYHDMLFHGQWRMAFKNACFALCSRPRSQSLHRQFLEAASIHGWDEEATHCLCLTSSIGKIFQMQWFADTLEMPFEDTTLPVPRQYEAYLTLIYQHWRAWPPADKRKSVHECRYINLDGRVRPEGF